MKKCNVVRMPMNYGGNKDFPSEKGCGNEEVSCGRACGNEVPCSSTYWYYGIYMK